MNRLVRRTFSMPTDRFLAAWSSQRDLFRAGVDPTLSNLGKSGVSAAAVDAALKRASADQNDLSNKCNKMHATHFHAKDRYGLREKSYALMETVKTDTQNAPGKDSEIPLNVMYPPHERSSSP